MKTYILIFLTLFLNACNASKKIQSDLAESNTEISTNAKTTQSEIKSFEYSAVKANKDKITYQLSRTSKEEIKDCTTKNWENLTNLASNFDITKINEFEAPSKAHQYDGAAIANLKIFVGEKTYGSQSFDAGNPPKEIAELVNYLLNLVPKN